jgi:nucleoside-diphosphate-sugar epimerase
MKVFVTGGTGFIGSHLIERLAAEGHEVVALARRPDKLIIPPGSAVRALPGDLSRLPDLPTAIDLVFHLAASTKTLKRGDYYNVNRDGTARLFAALRRLPTPPKTVLLSSLAAGGPSWAGRSRKESDPAEPMTPYGVSKLMAETEALAHKDVIPLVILRVGAVYGPRDKDFLGYFRAIQKSLMPIIGRKPRPMTLCYVFDTIQSLLVAAKRPVRSGEVFNIGDAVAVTWERLGAILERILGKKAVRIPIPPPLAYIGALCVEGASFISRRPTVVTRAKVKQYLQPGWEADVSKAREFLGFVTSTSLEDGIRETATWYRNQGWL